MLHARDRWQDGVETAEIVAFPRASVEDNRAFGRRPSPEKFSLVVDLRAEDIGKRWFRGAATLTGLCALAFFLSPGFEPFIASKVAAAPVTRIHNASLSDLAAGIAAKPSIPKPVGIQVGESNGVRRINGDVAGGLYWSLRSAGASPKSSRAAGRSSTARRRTLWSVETTS